MKRVSLFLFILVFVLLGLNGQWYSNSNILPIVKKGSDNIQFEVKSLKKDMVFYIHYRTKGPQGFQVRKMNVGEDGKIYFHLSTKNLYGKKLEYYITQSGGSKINNMTPVFTVTNFTQQGSPLIYFMAGTAGDISEKKEREHIIKLAASLSSTSQISDTSEYPGEKFTADGNFRLYRNIYKEKYQFDFDSNFTYTKAPAEGEKNINLSNMMVRYTRGIHKIEAGDVNVSISEFTAPSLSRRGLSYILDHKTFYFSTFFTNSQQKTGFDGFGIPATNSNIFGTVIGFKKDSFFEVKGLFMSGTDNLDSKTVSSTGDQFRNGSMMAAWSSLNLFNSQLTFKGEYAKSNFGKGADEDSIVKESGTAFQTQMNFNYKVFSGNASYKKVGNHFNSIANLFLQNDREGLDGGLSLAIDAFTLSVTYSDQITYKESTVQPMLNTKDITATVSWMLGNHVKIDANYGLNNQDYDEKTGLQSGDSDMNTLVYGGTLAFIAGSNGIHFHIGTTESENSSSDFLGSVSLNLRLGQFFSIDPSITYQITDNLSDNTTSKMTSAYVNSEITFVPEILSISFSGSYTTNDNDNNNSTSISATGSLNFNMAKIFKDFIQPTLSLKTKYQQSKYTDSENNSTDTSSYSIYLQADISF